MNDEEEEAEIEKNGLQLEGNDCRQLNAMQDLVLLTVMVNGGRQVTETQIKEEES